MAKNKKAEDQPEKRGRGRPPVPPEQRTGRTGRMVQVWLDQELAAVLEKYVETTKPRPTLTAVVEVALEEYLRRVGAFPTDVKGG